MKPNRKNLFITASAAFTIALIAQSANAQALFWDANNGTSGFGSGSGTWAAPTTGTATAGWSTSSTGVTAISGNSVTTTTGNAINFGTDNATFGFGGGTITVSGTVDAASIKLGNQASGGLVLSGGTINFAAATSINNGSGTQGVTISSQITGATTSLTKSGPGGLTLSGASTYTGSTLITGGALNLANANTLGSNPGVNGTSGISISAGAILSSTLGGADPSNTVSAPITLVTGGNTTLRIGQGASGNTHTFNINGAIGGATTNLVYTTGTNSFSNGGSVFVLGAAGTYTGNTTITTGNGANNPVTVMSGVANALPVTTVVTMTGGAGGGSGRSLTLDLNGNSQTLAGLTHTATIPDDRNYRVSSATAATLTINNTADFSFGGATKDSDVAPTANPGSITSAQITGAISLVKSGAGTFTLGGTLTNGATAQGNSFTGSTTILGGILNLGQTISIQSSAFNTAGSIAGDATNGLSTTVTTLTMGGLTGNKNFADVFTTALGGTGGATARGGYDGLTNLTLNPGSGVTRTYSGDIGNGAGAMTLTKAGLGTQILSAANSYTGGTIVSSGTLRLAVNDALGTGAFLQGNTGANNTIVDLNGKNQTVAGLAGNTVTTGSNTITNNGATDSVLTLSGLTVERGSNFTITDGATNKVSLVLDNGNANAQRLYFGSTYSGGTTLLAGRLNVEHSNALGTAGVSLAGTNAQLRLASGLVAGTTTVTLPAGNSITVSDTGDNKVLAAYGPSISHVIEGGITINETTSGNFELQVGDTTTLTINGAITGTGGAGIRKTLTGTVVLNSTNDYTGTTLVSAGSLIINGAVASTTVTTNAYLGGRGVMANATVGGSGSVNPGNSPGIMTAAATDPTGGLDYNFEFTAEGTAPTWSNAGASVNDVLRLTSATPFTASLGATNQITLYLGIASLTEGDVFTGGFYTDNSADFLATINSAVFKYFLADAGGLTTYNGNTYTEYTGPLGFERATVLVGSANFAAGTISGGYVTQFTVVPEPNVAALIGALGGILLLRRRR